MNTGPHLIPTAADSKHFTDYGGVEQIQKAVFMMRATEYIMEWSQSASGVTRETPLYGLLLLRYLG